MTKPKATKTAAPAVVDKSRTLQLESAPGKTPDRQMADLVTHGIATNALTAMRFMDGDLPGQSLSEMVASLREHGQATNRGDLSRAEAMLSAQAVALNTIFAELARRSALNMGEHLDAADRYMRLALKAQGQCRATIETLAAIKNPPVVFARQMNVAHGPQQVNNGSAPNGKPASTHPGETASEPTELLQDLNDGRTQLDTRATPATGREDPRLEPVGEVNRAAQP
jgi:hypothetical protein